MNGLRLPSLLVRLIRQGRWTQPRDEAVAALAPFLCGPVNFLPTVESIERASPRLPLADADIDEESRALERASEAELVRSLRMASGSRAGRPVDLPWLDLDQAVVIAVSRHHGDDLLVALDYRAGDDPRVVATDWDQPTGSPGCAWREVAPSFTHFVEVLRLGEQDAEPRAAADRGLDSE